MPLVGFGFAATALDFLETVPHKIRRQLIRKAKALHTDPFPPGCNKLHGVETNEGMPVYRQRSGDYRILYVVKQVPPEVIILDIDNRKDVYKMPKTDVQPTDEMRIQADVFDEMMRSALDAPSPENPKGKKQAKSGVPSNAKAQPRRVGRKRTAP